MACPKVNPRYPSGVSSIEVPFLVAVMKADPNFAKDKRFDLAYEFQLPGRLRPRQFFVDSLLSGAYAPSPYGFSSAFSAGFDTLDATLRKQNGFCG